MTGYSKHMTYDQVKALVKQFEDNSYESKRDGCVVTLVKCAECSKMFEEELETAKEKAISKLDLLCLACDEDAVVPSFTGVTVKIGWFWP